MPMAAATVLLNFPPSLRIIKPNSHRTNRTSRTAALACVLTDGELGPGSLGHLTRRDFPILQQESNGKRLVYLDNAAMSQTPAVVLDASRNYYEAFNLNVHRVTHCLSAGATDKYELVRQKVADFINAPECREIVFTRNATDAINLVAYTWGLSNLKKGDEILLTVAEHHSAIVPWQMVAQKTGAVLKYVSLTEDEVPDVDKLRETLSRQTKIVVVHHISNMLGE